MCNLSDNVEKRGIEKGQKIANAKNLIKLMKKMKFSLSDAMAMLEIDPSEHDVYQELIEQLTTLQAEAAASLSHCCEINGPF